MLVLTVRFKRTVTKIFPLQSEAGTPYVNRNVAANENVPATDNVPAADNVPATRDTLTNHNIAPEEYTLTEKMKPLTEKVTTRGPLRVSSVYLQLQLVHSMYS